MLNKLIIILYEFKLKVSFIGLGVMGFPMAGHLANKNKDLKLKVYNRSIKKLKIGFQSLTVKAAI